MPRRAKIWICAVFVLLMAGLLVYLRLAWSPNNPLRFRVVDPQAVAAANASVYHRVVIEVENTSNFPLVLYVGEIGRSDWRTKTLGSIWPFDQDRSLLDASGDCIKLGGREHIQVAAGMNGEWHKRATEHGADVRYVWCSTAEHWVGKQWHRITQKIPDRVRESLPYPKQSVDTAPLEPFARDDGS